MADLEHLLRTACAFILQFHCILSFNLDTSIPIVKSGNPDSYFGFSVAQHIIAEERYSADGLTELPPLLKHVLLVGAPRDNVTVPSSPSVVRKTVRPGAIHKCAFSSSKDDCEQLELMVNEPQTDFRGNPEEDRSNQWLGVSVASTGTPDGKALACAHRWKKVAYNRAKVSAIWGPGICVYMYNSLDQDNFFDVCGDKSTERGHQDYGFCQAGISASASKEDDVLMGASGVYTWRGMVAKNKFFSALGDDTNMYLNNHLDYAPPIQPVQPDTEYFSYLGMSTAIGRLIRNETTYVSGAPRSKDAGQVFLYKQGNSILEKQLVLSGDQFGSYFGYSLAVEDVNGDGLQDLIVGAPFYFKEGIGGAIYVYISGPFGITEETEPIFIPSRKMTQTECKLLDCSNSRFGMSITGAGDINQDGFNDLAVGAPFEGDGVVYIFHGMESGINVEYVQRIEAADLMTARPLTTFGYSLSGGIDMDNNTYPDLVVGAYKSDKVVVLRTRPVINVTVEMMSTPEEIDPSSEDRCSSSGKEMRCFTLHVCFMFTAKPESDFPNGITLDYRIEAETFVEGTPSSRVTFRGADPNNKHIIARSSRLHPQSANRCKAEPHEVYIQKGNRDFLRPIDFLLTYKLKDQVPPVMNDGGPIPDINSYPVLNEKAASIIHSVEFKKNCGDDKRCQSDLQLDIKFLLTSSPGDDDTYMLRIGEDKEPTLDIVITNNNEDAHGAYLNLTLPNDLDYQGTNNIGDQDVSCIRDIPSNGRIIICGLGNPMIGKDVVKFQIRLNPVENLVATATPLDVKVTVNTTSDETNLDDNYKDFKIKVVVETDIKLIGTSIPKYAYFSGEVVGESAIRNENQIGSEVTHQYEVKNVGKGSVSNCSVKIWWPFELENGKEHGKHLLYLIDYPVIDNGKCFLEDWMVNPVNIKVNPKAAATITYNTTDPEGPPSAEIQASERVKREEPQAISSDDKKVAMLDCDKGTAKCFSFRCTIGLVKPQDSILIMIRSRLWNSTFLEDFVEYSSINVYSKGEVTIPQSENVQQLNMKNDISKALTVVIPDITVKPPEQVPLWIIIVAVLAGVILLAVLIVLLWKCGFFNRNKAEDMQKHKAKVEKKDSKKHIKYEKTYNNYD